MKRQYTLIELLVVAAAAWIFTGMMFSACAPAPIPQPTPVEKVIGTQLAELKQQLTEANAKLDRLEKRRFIFPLGNKPDMAAPDIRAAVGHSLMAAADLCGRDKVVGFFEDMGSDIRKTLVPIDPLGVADKKARELSAKKINSLLQ
jgi:hypothetical protein